MIFNFEKFIKDKVSVALEGCFTDAMIYGTGYIKVSLVNDDLNVEVIPFTKIEEELESLKELKSSFKNL